MTANSVRMAVIIGVLVLVFLSVLPVLNLNAPAVAQTGNTAGAVKYTLILFNNTLLPGDVVAYTNGIEPWGIVYDPQNGYIYVTDRGSDSVSVIDPSTNKVIANILVGRFPLGIIYDPQNGYLYVANFGSNTVSVIDPSTNTVIANISVGLNPMGIAYDPQNGYIYVTNSLSGTLSIIATTNTTQQYYRVTFVPVELPFPNIEWRINVYSSTGVVYANYLQGYTNVTLNLPAGVYTYYASDGFVTINGSVYVSSSTTIYLNFKGYAQTTTTTSTSTTTPTTGITTTVQPSVQTTTTSTPPTSGGSTATATESVQTTPPATTTSAGLPLTSLAVIVVVVIAVATGAVLLARKK